MAIVTSTMIGGRSTRFCRRSLPKNSELCWWNVDALGLYECKWQYKSRFRSNVSWMQGILEKNLHNSAGKFENWTQLDVGIGHATGNIYVKRQSLSKNCWLKREWRSSCGNHSLQTGLYIIEALWGNLKQVVHPRRPLDLAECRNMLRRMGQNPIERVQRILVNCCKVLQVVIGVKDNKIILNVGYVNFCKSYIFNLIDNVT